MGQSQSALEALVTLRPDRNFWNGRRVFLTGHTGFKGAWAALWLKRLGAKIYGFALPPATQPNLWEEVGSGLLLEETLADLSDRQKLELAIERANPQAVIHMAAQALVRKSYADPLSTIATNTMGTVHLLEALRRSSKAEIVLVVTTDKVYANDETHREFVETDPLGGHDPYSASKAAAEILARSYAQSFCDAKGIKVATARAGNVVGGGDWSVDRLVPDVWRAAQSGQPLRLRFPRATRPWQHVLEPLAGYFRYMECLCEDEMLPRSLNFGPASGQVATVATVAERVGTALGLTRSWEQARSDHPREMATLSINPQLAMERISWRPKLSLDSTLEWTAAWYAAFNSGQAPRDLCLNQIDQYEALA